MADSFGDFEDRLKTLKSKKAEIAAEMKTINDRVAAGERPTKSLERVGNLMKGAERIDEAIAAVEAEQLEHVFAGVKSGRYGTESGDGSTRQPSFVKAGQRPVGGLVQSMVDAGFDLKSHPSVAASTFDALQLKTSTFPDAEDWSLRAPIIIPKGRDTRFLWPSLATEDAGTALTIQDFKQTARSVTGTVERAVDAATDKAELDVTIELATEVIGQHAITIDDIPNALFLSLPQLSAFLESEARFQIYKSIDSHVMAQIVAATPAYGNTGTNLIDKARNAVTAMRATGADPTLLVLNPTDAATLDTYQTADGIFISPTAQTGGNDPLWGMRIVERIGAGTEAPYLIDPVMLGVIYLGQLRFDADPYTGFKKNLTTLRLEVNALFHVRNINGAYRVAAS